MRALLFGLALAAAAAPAFAHGVGGRVIAAPATIVELYYADGEPMAFARAQVFSPDAPDAPFFNGRADRLGRVAFAPDREGTWRVTAQDEEGHRLTVEATVGSGAAASASGARALRWLAWASLCANIFALAQWVATRREPLRPTDGVAA